MKKTYSDIYVSKLLMIGASLVWSTVTVGCAAVQRPVARAGVTTLGVAEHICPTVTRAAEAWNVFAGSQVFQVVCGLNSNLDVLVLDISPSRWDPIPHCLELGISPLTVAVTVVKGGARLVFSCHTPFDNDYWETVWTHELGHVLGYDHTPESLMQEALNPRDDHPMELTPAVLNTLIVEDIDEK